MHWVSCEVATVCCGIAMSGGSLVLAGGAPGKRRATPNSRILIHQPFGAFRGQSTDVEIHAREALRLRRQYAELDASRCGRGPDEVEAALERDRFFGPEEALAFGLIDEVR
jgi:ATP-dependent Clp protease, protease subunit